MSIQKEKLLILADDLTGALDTGVQLSVKGYQVNILTENSGIPIDENADVLVINTDTRHVNSDEAYTVISKLVIEAMLAGFHRIYKKTDSGLRGNVGAELTALLKTSGEKTLVFVPAWPKMNRITKEGIHYVNGLPLAQSIFAKDPINPVKESRVDRLIQMQSDVNVCLCANGTETEGIAVYDCTDDEEMERIASKLFADQNRPLIAAGCAGLLEKYPSCAKNSEIPYHGELYSDMLILCGSLNEVSAKQLRYAEDNGAYRVHLPVHRVITGKWDERDTEQFVQSFLLNADQPINIIDTMDDSVYEDDTAAAAKQIAERMGETAASLMKQEVHKTLMIIGGDTLLACVKALGIKTLTPVKEMAPGTVLAKYTHSHGFGCMITKSGGFGSETLLVKLQKELEENRI